MNSRIDRSWLELDRNQVIDLVNERMLKRYKNLPKELLLTHPVENNHLP